MSIHSNGRDMMECTRDMRKMAVTSAYETPFGKVLFEKSTHQAHLDPSLIAISLRYRLDDTLKLHHGLGLKSSF